MEPLKRTLFLIPILIVCLIFSPVALRADNPVKSTVHPSFWDKKEPEELADELVRAMSPEELLGQVFFLGYIGKEPSKTIMKWIGERNLGGVKIFTRNVGSLSSLAESISRMQKLALHSKYGIPLFMATDQEGGWVRHIKLQTSVTPGNLALGAEGKAVDSFLTGYHIGTEIRKLGINMNFAPTADVYSNPKASVIGPRAFSSDPMETALLAAAYFKGMKRAGIICTAKHYPGHGDADKDSHGFLPVIRVSFDTLWKRDLLPYRILIKEGLPAIMSGHLAFPEITGNNIPSSLSPFFQREVLRERLNFEGIIITDDMEMGGILRSGESTPTACRKAILAGNDMVLISHSPPVQEKTWEYLKRTSLNDEAFMTALRDAVKKILLIKLKYLKGNIIPESRNIEEKITDPRAREFFFNAACRSVTVIRNKRLPIEKNKLGKVLLVGQFEEFLEAGLERLPGAETFFFHFSPFYHARKETIRKINSIAGKYDTIIFGLANFNSLDVLKSLTRYKKRIIVLSALTPVYLDEVPWVDTAVAVYGMGKDSFRAGFAVLMGDFEARGKLPINFRELP